ncbi:hypothetical protein CLW00_106263 [Mongoliibacter ruber]|uniref:Uncharacterized protein n=1 Tax=Mongoliibacter ruber TaxID=1750599 RepID=A0A2T0WLR3_9BACT|nr:hypothetical protein CLW00_106263 [Mongoliibacter ruber]
MDSNKDFIKLKSLINEVFGVKDISYDTELNNLKTLSEDNDRFIELFQSEFNINMSSFPYQYRLYRIQYRLRRKQAGIGRIYRDLCS